MRYHINQVLAFNNSLSNSMIFSLDQKLLKHLVFFLNLFHNLQDPMNINKYLYRKFQFITTISLCLWKNDTFCVFEFSNCIWLRSRTYIISFLSISLINWIFWSITWLIYFISTRSWYHLKFIIWSLTPTNWISSIFFLMFNYIFTRPRWNRFLKYSFPFTCSNFKWNSPFSFYLVILIRSRCNHTMCFFSSW